MKILEFYFKPKGWEGSGLTYEIIGVRLFKKFVVQLGRITGQKSSKRNNYFL